MWCGIVPGQLVSVWLDLWLRPTSVGIGWTEAICIKDLESASL